MVHLSAVEGRSIIGNLDFRVSVCDVTSFAAGNPDAKSCTTTTYLDVGIGPNRSTDTVSQHFSGTRCGLVGSFVFLSTNMLQWLHALTKSSIFFPML